MRAGSWLSAPGGRLRPGLQTLRSLRFRIILLLMLTFTPLFAWALIDAANERERQLRAAEDEALTAARVTAAAHEQIFETTEVVLSSLTHHPDVAGRMERPEACAARLDEVRAVQPLYANLGVVERDGSVSCTALAMEGSVNLSDRFYVQGALRDNGFTIGDYQVGRITNLPTVNFGYPLRDGNGEPEAVLYAALDLTAFSQLIARSSAPPEGQLLVVDREGTVLAEGPEPAGRVGESLAGTGLGQDLQSLGRVGALRTAGPGEEALVVGAVLVGHPDTSHAFVVATLPEARVLRGINAALGRQLGLLGLVGAGALLVSWVGAKRWVVRPLEEVVDATERIAAGERGLQLGGRSNDGEMGRLKAAFSRMSLALQEREQALVATETARLQSELRFANVLDHAADAIITVDQDLRIRRFNRGAAETFWWREADMLGQSLERVVPGRLVSVYSQELRRFISSLEASRQFGDDGRLQLCRSDGGEFPASVTVSKLAEGGETLLSFIIRDISLQEEAREVLLRRAFFDELTGLPNRSWLLDEMAAHVEAEPLAPFAVLAVGLVRFREVNATFGFEVGDAVLNQLGPRLEAAGGPGSRVVRLDGDRFAVLVAGDDANLEVFRDRAAAVATSFERPFSVRGEPIAVEGGVGVAVYPEHATDPEMLLRRADVALAVAHETASGFVVYEPERHDASVNHVQVLGELRRALDEDGLELHYQPLVELRSGSPVGVEALVRWPDGGLSPAEFIPMAERTGLIRRIDAWVLERAIRQAAAWRQAALSIPVSVNLSARSFQNPGLPGQVQELLKRWDVPAELVELEITETAMMGDAERAAAICAELRGMGVGIAVDDFGIGYSSLTYLHRMRVSSLKIDRSFVKDLGHGEDARAIVQAMVDLGQRLGLRIIAEGIEDGESARQLASMGCHCGQGYFYARPVPATEVQDWLENKLAA